MKKMVAAAALTAAITAMASAEITFGSWGRGLWITAANNYNATDDKTEIVQDVHQSWGGVAPRTALAVSGDSEHIGFKLDIHSNASTVKQGDNAHIWAKPIDQVKLYVGNMDVNKLRGDGAFGLWNWDRIGCVDKKISGEGWTFPGFVKNSGVSIEITPMEGLTVIADIPLALDGTKDKFSNIYGHKAKYGMGYDIQDVGTVKFAIETRDRYLKKGDKEKSNNVQLDAAFDLTSVENAFFSFGVRVPTLIGAYNVAVGTDGKVAGNSNDVVITGYGKYGVNEAMTVHGLFGVNIGADLKESGNTDLIEKDSGAVGFSLGAGLDYNLGEFIEGVSAFADVRYASGIWVANTSADKTDCVTFGLGLQKNFSNGLIGIGFEGTTHGTGRYNYKDQGFAWEVPVKFEYFF